MDTSAFYASLNEDDAHHLAARQALEHLKEADLFTTNYVLLECTGLLQKRKGLPLAQTFLTRTTNALEILWIDEALHREAVSLWEKSHRRGLSLVDCASFAAMRHASIRQAAAFDEHFADQGFDLIP